MTRAEQKAKRQQEILFTALELFIRKGYAATKISDIATAVGMSTGLLFHYFDSKEHLYEELIRMGVDGPKSVMDIPGEPLVFFEVAAREILTYISTEPYVAKVFVLMSQALHNESIPEGAKALLANMDNISPSVEKIIAGQNNHTIREGNPYALAVAFWAAISGIAEMVALTPDCPCPESEWLVDLIRAK